MPKGDGLTTDSRGRTPGYRYATRLNSFKPVAASSSGADLVRAAGRVRGLGALELNYPQQGEAIKMLREAGDVVWEEIQRMQQSQQQDSQ